MKTAKIAIGLLLVAIAAFGAVTILQGGKTDQQLIEETLREAIVAGKEGRPGSVLEHLSRSFEINGEAILNQEMVARYIRENRPDVEIETFVADVQGDSALIETPVKLKLSGPLQFSATLPGVRIEFQKEHATKYLVFPDRKWRLTKVSVPPEAWSKLVGF